MFYDFNPRHRANHVERTYLGKPGTCNIYLGTEYEDPKYSGPCGEEYTRYKDCLVEKQFNRTECRGSQQSVIHCQETKLGDQSAQLAILSRWRKNKGKPVKSSYVPFKIFDEQPQRLDKV